MAANSIKGSRVGSGPMGEVERGSRAPAITMSYWCANQHESQRLFSKDSGTEVPQTWDCPRCGLPAGQNQAHPPAAVRIAPFKTHLAYVKERRSETDGAELLDEALVTMRRRRGISPN